MRPGLRVEGDPLFYGGSEVSVTWGLDEGYQFQAFSEPARGLPGEARKHQQKRFGSKPLVAERKDRS